MKRTLFCCGLLLCSAGFAAAQVTEDPPARFLAARAEFEQGRAGVGGANQRAAEGFQALVEAHPGHPLFRVYLGSTYALKARDGWFPFTRLRNVETGLDHVSKALGLLRPEHDEQAVYADKAYDSRARRKRLRERGVFDRILKQARRNRPLTDWERTWNRYLSAIRSPAERVFGTLKRGYGFFRARYLGLARDRNHALLLAIAFNLRKAVRLAGAS